MRNIYAFRKGFRVQLSYKHVTYHGPLRPTQAAASADLSIVKACASREEQVKYLRKLVHLEKNRRTGEVSTAAGAAKDLDGQVPAEPQETDMAEGGAGEQQEAPVMGQEAVAPAEKHAGEEPKAAEAPAMDVGEQEEAPGRGQVAEESVAVHAGEEPEATDLMATQAAGEPQATDVVEGCVGDEQEAPGMGQVAEAPAAVDAGEEPEARGARLFLVLEKPYFDVMVSGENTVEYREKIPYWEQRLTDGHGRPKQFDYVEFQCGFTHPLPRFRAAYLGLSIVNEHQQEWSNRSRVDFKDTPTYAIRLGPVMGRPFLAPRKEKKAAGPATPKKRSRSVGLVSPGTGRKARRKCGREAVSTAKCDQRGSRRGVQVHARL